MDRHVSKVYITSSTCIAACILYMYVIHVIIIILYYTSHKRRHCVYTCIAQKRMVKHNYECLHCAKNVVMQNYGLAGDAKTADL